MLDDSACVSTPRRRSLPAFDPAKMGRSAKDAAYRYSNVPSRVSLACSSARTRMDARCRFGGRWTPRTPCGLARSLDALDGRLVNPVLRLLNCPRHRRIWFHPSDPESRRVSFPKCRVRRLLHGHLHFNSCPSPPLSASRAHQRFRGRKGRRLRRTGRKTRRRWHITSSKGRRPLRRSSRRSGRRSTLSVLPEPPALS